MSDRVIDSTRQGVSHEPEQVLRVPDAEPVSLEDALRVVDGWLANPDTSKWGLHQVAIALRREVLVLLASEARLQAELAAKSREVNSVKGKAAQAGVALDAPIMVPAKIEDYPLSEVLDLMDSWREDVEGWGLHQMCRVLREAYEAVSSGYAEEADYAERYKTAYDEKVRAFQSLHETKQILRSAFSRERAAAKRALAAIPCARVRDDCPGQDYPWAPCCNLRVALLPGEPVIADHLAEEGWIHLFEAVDPANPTAPRKSAGCFRLIGYEPAAPVEDGGVGSCEHCGDAFVRANWGMWRKFCSAACRMKAWRERRRVAA